MNPIETVQSIYAAFGRGDIPSILALLAEDVSWEYGTSPNPVPWLQPLSGRAQVPKFFDALFTHVEMNAFTPRHILADGAFVVSVVDAAFTVRATGKQVVEQDEVHLWAMNDQGRVARFRHRVDTWQHVKALTAD